MIAKQFLEGTGIGEKTIALSVEIPDYNDFLYDIRDGLFNDFTIDDSNFYFTSIKNENREVIFINQDHLAENKTLLGSVRGGGGRLIFIFRDKKISNETRFILSQYDIPLLDLPIPKPENDCAKSSIAEKGFKKYFESVYNHPQTKFWYDLVISVLGGLLSNFLSRGIR